LGEEPSQLTSTSEQKPTGEAVRLSPRGLEEVRAGVRFEEAEGAPSPDTASPSTVFPASPTPMRMDRRPTGKPTNEQIRQAWQQEGAAAAPYVFAPERREKVRKDTGHPHTESRRTKAKRALAKLFGA
jgi:hypothetical protein